MADVEYDYKQPLNRLWGLISAERKVIYLLLYYAFVGGAIVLTLPLGIQALLNFILGGRLTSSWLLLVILVLGGLVLSGLVQIAQMKLTERLQQRIFANASFDMALRMPQIKLGELHNEYPPELINRFFDTITVQKSFAKLLIDYPTSIFQVFFGLVLISVYHPVFLFYSLGILVFLYFLFRFTGPKGVVTSLKESSKKYEVAHWLEELARAIGTFKLAGVSALPIFRIDKLIMGYLYYRRMHFSILILQFKILVGFKVVSVGLLLVLGSLLLIEQQISLGQFVAVEIIIILIMNSVDKLIIGLDSVYDLLTSIEKLGSIFDLKLEDNNETKTSIASEDIGFAVTTQGLTFKYPDTERIIIDNLSISIPAGTKAALVGLPGSGKSSVLHLLTGIYENYKGRITFNGMPLTALKLDMLRLQIGENLWRETIFEGTLRENITLGRENISDKMILAALDTVSATGDMNYLNQGLSTILLPGGIKLNKSFAARIMLARSIVAKPHLVLLELDLHYMRLEEKTKFFNFLCGDHATLIAVANDDELLRRCDQIIFMQLGKVVFTGTYNEFKDSEYAKSIQ